MSIKKRILAMLIVATFILSVFQTNLIFAGSENGRYLEAANKLKTLNLFVGSKKGFELTSKLTREQAVIILLRMLGLEGEADDENLQSTFSDVAKGSWSEKYIAYASKIGLTSGVSKGKFGLGMSVKANQFITFALRALGYNEKDGDFTWTTSFDKAKDIGLLTDSEVKEYKSLGNKDFIRDNVVNVMCNALKTDSKSGKTLLQTLYDKGEITKEQIAKTNDATFLTVLDKAEKIPAAGGITPTSTPKATYSATPCHTPYVQSPVVTQSAATTSQPQTTQTQAPTPGSTTVSTPTSTSAANTSTPVRTPTPAVTAAMTATPVATPSATPTAAPTATATAVPTQTPEPTTAPPTAPPTPAPIPLSFSLKDVNGNTVNLSDLRGKKVMLNFWSKYCGSCIEELPQVLQVQNDNDPNVVVIIIDPVDTAAVAKKTIEDKGWNFNISLIDQDGALFDELVTKLSSLATFEAPPISVFIDRNGNVSSVIASESTYERFKAELAKIQ